ncbi:MAG: hypothetical protein KDJ88_20145 [Bauldia sp.]|nr:hypothetical protein [Bauldia sp.]
MRGAPDPRRFRLRPGLFLATALGFAALSIAPLAAGDSLPGDEYATNLERLEALDLPSTSDTVTVYYSPDVSGVAATYAATLTRAVAWFRDQLGWSDPVIMAVLDSGDYARVTAWPYPIPHAERSTGLVIMPDSIESYPGFERWPFDAVTLNADLTAHEIGHVIAWQTGIWSNSHWVNELVADVFLAGYIHALKPDDRALLAGVPAGFEDAGKVKSLAELDLYYAGIGLENYAWFQFRLAALADYLVADGDFAGLIGGLRAAFPKQDFLTGDAEPTTAEAFRRLEALRPGVTALAGDLTGPDSLTTIAAVACGPEPAPVAQEGVVVIENDGDRPLKVNQRQLVRSLVEIDIAFETDLEGEALEAELDRLTDEAMTGDDYARIVPAGTRLHFQDKVGAQLHLVGGDCLIVRADPSRFDWAGD